MPGNMGIFSKKFVSPGGTVAILVFLVVQNVNTYMIGNNPHHRAETLDSKGKYQLEWLVDWDRDIVTFNVTVETRGYVGFGLSTNGKMGGADIVIGGVRPNGEVYFKDRHAVGNHVPEVDSSQDWKLLGAWQDKTHTFLSFSRPFDTCDPQDYPITENKVSLIWAFGEKDNELEYHHQNKGQYAVYLLDPDYTPPASHKGVRINTASRKKEDLKVWAISTKLVLPARDTMYWCTIHAPPRLGRKHHIVGMETTFPSDQSRRHSHHIAIHKCHVPPELNARSLFEPFLNYRGNECFMIPNPAGPIPSRYCTEFYWVWAIGGRAYFTPPDVGFPIGESPDEFFLVQMHYDNPNELPNMLIEANVNMYYTPNLRPNDGGLFVLRTPSPGQTPTILVPSSTVEHNVYAHCSPECTREMLTPSGIKISGAFLHSHNSGVALRFQQFRKDRELPWILWDDNYENTYQEFRSMRNEVQVLPGDQLTIQCTYDTTWTNHTVVSGYSTRQEMCVVLALYHTKLLNHGQCFSEVVSDDYREHFLGIRNVTWSTPDLEYLVSSPHPLAGLTMTQISDNHVSWTIAKREELKRFHRTHPQVNHCPRLTPDSGRTTSVGNAGFISTEDVTPSVSYPVNAMPYKPQGGCSYIKG